MKKKTANIDIKALLEGDITYDAIKSGKVPIDDPKIGDLLKLRYINLMQDEQVMFKAPDEAIDLFKEYLEELCARNNVEAKTIKAYCLYGGNRAYSTDWFGARDIMLDVLAQNGDPFIANALGYIYYYGRCSDGKPDYDKAFYYFSIGAADDIFESKYKIADMFYHGRAVPKNIALTTSIITNLYTENLDIFRAGILDGKFADLALRMSNLDIQHQIIEGGLEPYETAPELDSDGYSQADYNASYYFLMQAKYAIDKRIATLDLYGDNHVKIAIEEQIDKVYKLSSFKDVDASSAYEATAISFPSISIALDKLLKFPFDFSDDLYYATYLGEDDGSRRFFVSSAKCLYDNCIDILVTLPEADFCSLTPGLMFDIKGDGEIKLTELDQDRVSERALEPDETFAFSSWGNNSLNCAFENSQSIVFDNDISFSLSLNSILD